MSSRTLPLFFVYAAFSFSTEDVFRHYVVAGAIIMTIETIVNTENYL